MHVLDLADDVLVLAGLIWLVVRQFQWRDPARMLPIGIGLVAVGAVLVLQETATGSIRWRAVDAAVLPCELLLTAAIGVLMGLRYRFRADPHGVSTRLEGSGIALWALFLLVRLGSIGVAHLLGADAITSTGVLLLAFGTNRLATAVVVRRRLVGRSAVVPRLTS